MLAYAAVLGLWTDVPETHRRSEVGGGVGSGGGGSRTVEGGGGSGLAVSAGGDGILRIWRLNSNSRGGGGSRSGGGGRDVGRVPGKGGEAVEEGEGSRESGEGERAGGVGATVIECVAVLPISEDDDVWAVSGVGVGGLSENSGMRVWSGGVDGHLRSWDVPSSLIPLKSLDN
jgi:hypothetical protein